MNRTRATVALFALLASVLGVGRPCAADSARAGYARTLARERVLRDAQNTATLQDLRAVVVAYERIAKRYPSSGYSDNALWQGGNLALLAWQRFGEAPDRRTGVRLLQDLKARYPTSSLVPRVDPVLAELASPKLPVPPVPAEKVADTNIVTIRDIKRTPLADGIRVTIEMDAEAVYHQERVDSPDRVFFDLKRTRAVRALQDATIRFRDDDIVKEIRLGRHPQNTTRVVMDVRGVETYSIFTLYDPFRLIIDFRRSAAPTANASAAAANPPAATNAPANLPAPPVAAPEPSAAAEPGNTPPAADAVPLISREPAAPVRTPPAVPATNSNGQFSLARQLGLGVSRIVLDPGHGGHDPGAQSNGVTEAELVLDVALRVRKLLEQQPGVEVTMTRDTEVFIPLEERTAIANREAADLFLSIHANASRNPKARGVETYFLNFSTNPEAEAVAARENSASGRTMHSLPDILKAIALNNKIDESRDFAATVQRSMVKRLAPRNKLLKDLGVKQAPFVVLIGASMPSVLAEISFVTNRQEGALLKTSAYRQRIAEALLDAIVRYQQSLKKMTAVATTGQR